MGERSGPPSGTVATGDGSFKRIPSHECAVLTSLALADGAAPCEACEFEGFPQRRGVGRAPPVDGEGRG